MSLYAEAQKPKIIDLNLIRGYFSRMATSLSAIAKESYTAFVTKLQDSKIPALFSALSQGSAQIKTDSSGDNNTAKKSKKVEWINRKREKEKKVKEKKQNRKRK